MNDRNEVRCSDYTLFRSFDFFEFEFVSPILFMTRRYSYFEFCGAASGKSLPRRRNQPRNYGTHHFYRGRRFNVHRPAMAVYEFDHETVFTS